MEFYGTMNIFATFEARVRERRAGPHPDPGTCPRGSTSPAWWWSRRAIASHGDLATNAALVLAKEAKTNPKALGETLAADLRADPDVAEASVAGPGFINLRLAPGIFHDVVRAALTDGRGLRARRHAGGPGQHRVRLGQSHRPDACGPWARRGVRRRAGQPARGRRARRDARILHQRCRRAGRRARPLGLPALPRGARARRRPGAGGALSGRLPRAGRARGSPRLHGARPPRPARGRVAADGAGLRHRRDDGPDPRRSRPARHPPRRVLLRSHPQGARCPSCWRSCARRASSTRAACRRPRASCPRIGRTASRPCSAPWSSATTSTGRC